jgi:hypothetical protein
MADMHGETLNGSGDTPLGGILSAALSETKEKNEQAILFINRRGYHKYVSCLSCKNPVMCPHCSVPMTLHKKSGMTATDTVIDPTQPQGTIGGILVCHYCGTHVRTPQVCPSCQAPHLHAFGYGTQRAEDDLEKRFPDIRFVHCWMDPIMQKSGPTPDQKLRRAMMDLIPGQKTERSSQSSIPGQKTERSELHSIPGQKTQDRLVFLGDVLALDPESELMRLAKVVNEGFLRSEDGSTGRQIMQIQDCCSLDEYLAMSDAGVIVTRTAVAEPSLRATARRLGAKPMFLPFTFRYEEIREALQGVAALFAADHKPEAETIRKRLAEAGIDFAREEAACEAALADALALIGDTPIAVDQIAV